MMFVVASIRNFAGSVPSEVPMIACKIRGKCSQRAAGLNCRSNRARGNNRAYLPLTGGKAIAGARTAEGGYSLSGRQVGPNAQLACA